MADNSDTANIPLDRRERNPLINAAGYRMLNRISQHRDAPNWNYVVGDRIEARDLPEVDAFRERVFKERGPGTHGPPESILDWVGRMREKSLYFRERLPEGFNLVRDWAEIETMRREDIVVRPEIIVPLDADLSRLIVYDTSGTTGHALAVPFHPRTMARNHPLLEYVLSRYGVRSAFGPDMVSCINVTARVKTVVFPNVFAVWKQSGFAKVNIHKTSWSDPGRARRFFKDLAPFFITGDPVGFGEMMRWEIKIRTAALVSTAVALSPGLKEKLEQYYACPVIDWYSVTETGPIAYACPHGRGLHVLPHDIYLEAVDEEGYPVENGQKGELTFTGGRNPYLPLLRYRTGDWGRLDGGPCSCGDPTPRIRDLDGRRPVLFRAADGSIVNPVDIGRVLRECVFVQHEVIQRVDGSLEVNIRPASGCPVDTTGMEKRLMALFGQGQKIMLKVDETLGERTAGGKVIPYRTEMIVEP